MSIKANIYNQDGDKVKEADLSESIFKVPVKEELVHQAMVCQMSNQRRNTASTKERAEVRGGGAKPWRQKGTGRARAGSSRSPIWIGGGVTFGPNSERNFKKKINKKMKRKAMFMVISDRLAENNMAIIDKLELKEIRTKTLDGILKNIEKKVFGQEGQAGKILIINDSPDENIKLSGRNLSRVSIMNLDNLNIVDLLNARKLIMTEEAAKRIEKTYKK